MRYPEDRINTKLNFKIKLSKILDRQNICICQQVEMFHAVFLGMPMTYLLIKFHISGSYVH